MSAFSAALDGAFASKRLHYIASEDDDEHYTAAVREEMRDAPLQALSSEMMLRPQNKKDIDFLASMFRKALLGVAICLGPEPSPDNTEDGGGDADPKKTKKKPTIIGTLCVGWGGIPESLRHNRNAYIGITLLKQYRGQGYGREALDWGVDWAFRHANLHTLSLTTFSFNEVGQKLYESVGFTYVGRRKEVAWANRAWHDELIYSMTEREWEVLRGLANDNKKE